MTTQTIMQYKFTTFNDIFSSQKEETRAVFKAFKINCYVQRWLLVIKPENNH